MRRFGDVARSMEFARKRATEQEGHTLRILRIFIGATLSVAFAYAGPSG
jgi:hypothetical protein